MKLKQIISFVIIASLTVQCQQSKEKSTETNNVQETKFDSTMEPLAGQPKFDSKSSTEDLDYQVKYHRAFEAVLWALPAVDIYRFRAAAIEDLGYKVLKKALVYIGSEIEVVNL